MYVNSRHPDLLNLIGNGVGLEEFVFAGSMAIKKNKGFGYALGIAKTRLQENQINKSESNAIKSQKYATPAAASEFAKKYSGLG